MLFLHLHLENSCWKWNWLFPEIAPEMLYLKMINLGRYVCRYVGIYIITYIHSPCQEILEDLEFFGMVLTLIKASFSSQNVDVSDGMHLYARKFEVVVQELEGAGTFVFLSLCCQHRGINWEHLRVLSWWATVPWSLFSGRNSGMSWTKQEKCQAGVTLKRNVSHVFFSVLCSLDTFWMKDFVICSKYPMLLLQESIVTSPAANTPVWANNMWMEELYYTHKLTHCEASHFCNGLPPPSTNQTSTSQMEITSFKFLVLERTGSREQPVIPNWTQMS